MVMCCMYFCSFRTILHFAYTRVTFVKSSPQAGHLESVLQPLADSDADASQPYSCLKRMVRT